MGGCTPSKLEKVDTVRLCKERRRLIKEAVYARNHLAAAHSDYLRFLRLTGSALVDFSSGACLSISDQTPPVHLHNPTSKTFTSPTNSDSTPLSQKPSTFTSSPAAPPSDQSGISSTPPDYKSYVSIPTQSAWNWENFYPPSPRKQNEENDDEEDVKCSGSGDHYSTISSDSELHDVDEEQVSNMKTAVRHRDLREIAGAIMEYFEKAVSTGEPVNNFLETRRVQLSRSFSLLKRGTSVKHQLDARPVVEPAGSKSHSSTLEQLLAWEKKLYEEVKAREEVNIEHKRKVSTLHSQLNKGLDETKSDKTKTSIKRLQSLIVVTSRAVSTTSSEIIDVRDTELATQLVDLCHLLMYMWRRMNQFHELQGHIVQQVGVLVNQTSKGQPTSELHREATRHLESIVSAWQSSFCRLIKYQRDYVGSLRGWLKLTLLHVGTNRTSDHMPPSSSCSSHLLAFLDEWKQALDSCPYKVASESMKSFVNGIHNISLKQAEEHKIKRKAVSVSRELAKKASALRNLENRFYQSYTTLIPDADGGQIIDARDPLAEKKWELAACQKRVEDEMSRHAKAVEMTRSVTVNNIQTGLPPVFQAMTVFSGLFTKALEGICTRSYSFI